MTDRSTRAIEMGENGEQAADQAEGPRFDTTGEVEVCQDCDHFYWKESRLAFKPMCWIRARQTLPSMTACQFYNSND